jgi:hypothetical protein
MNVLLIDIDSLRADHLCLLRVVHGAVPQCADLRGGPLIADDALAS